MKVHDTFLLKIFSPFQTFFEGEALAVSATNQTGPFDILAKHEDFISILSPCKIVVQTTSQKREFDVNRGILQVKNSRVWIFMNI